MFCIDPSDHPTEAQRLLASADLDICRRLLTTHVREDRFADGHFGTMIESGHIVAVLKRIEEIVADRETDTP